MAECSILPSFEMRSMMQNACENGNWHLLNMKIGRIAKGTDEYGRRVDSKGNLLEDIVIDRTDGSRFRIQEVNEGTDEKSDGLKRYRFTVLNPKGVLRHIFIYSEGIDLLKLQKDSEYLDIIADELLSKERIKEKGALSKEYGINYIYVGSVQQDKDSGDYVILEEVYGTVISAINEARFDKEKTKKLREIMKILQRKSLEELNEFSESLGQGQEK